MRRADAPVSAAPHPEIPRSWPTPRRLRRSTRSAAATAAAAAMRRAIRALNEWCVLFGGAGGHVRNVRALNEICALLGAEAGHFLEIRALNAIAAHLGGTRRPPPQPRRPDRDRRPHRHRLGRRPGPALRRRRQPLRRRPAGNPALRQRLRAAPLLGAQPRRLGAARQGGPRRAHRPLRHRRLHASSNGSTPTSPTSSPPWPTAGNPVVLIHLGTHSLPWVAAGRHAGPGHRRSSPP